MRGILVAGLVALLLASGAVEASAPQAATAERTVLAEAFGADW